ncbi:MAG: sigma-54-dependent Fis family transcriptional regulator [Planctomycetes bacterium]|nr:sigma-54-dependent Fis family transcriptional regulator [Planctomycetota bacterium]
MSPRDAVLLVEDEEQQLSLLAEYLERAGFPVRKSRSGAEGLRLLETDAEIGIVVTDMRMPGIDGLQLVRAIKEGWSDIQVIVMTAFGTIDSAVQATKFGAFQYLVKPFRPELLRHTIERASEVRRLTRENRSLRGGIGRDQVRIVGKTPGMQAVLDIVKRVAQNRSTVLIEGESGTGKELVARAIHSAGPQRDEPFRAVNCGAFSRHLLESELFGHRRGAFTSAYEDRVGLFESAGSGTVFLDEIGELPLDLQVKLLRVLQEKECTRVGDNKPIPVEARIMAASNRAIDALVREGQFREDLYWRINVVRISLPPLRERLEDLPDLVESFLDEFGRSFGVKKRVGKEAMEIIRQCSWPGNVRQLRNAIESAFALGSPEVIRPEDLPPWVREGSGGPVFLPGKETRAGLGGEEGRSAETARRGGGGLPTLEEAERELIERAMELSRGVKVEAARLLGIDRNRLARKLRKLQGGRRRRGAEGRQAPSESPAEESF